MIFLVSISWIGLPLKLEADDHVLNINAGFDETSELLVEKFGINNFTAFDFYNPDLHTEISIKRARRAYPPYPSTQSVETCFLPLADGSQDWIFVIFAAHEVRDETERVRFFQELKRILKPEGTLIVVEHLRDMPNFVAYNIGFFHFLSRKSWESLFATTQLGLSEEIKITPFVSAFILEKHGTTA